MKSSESAKSATICELYLGYCLHNRFARLQRETEKKRERERERERKRKREREREERERDEHK